MDHFCVKLNMELATDEVLDLSLVALVLQVVFLIILLHYLIFGFVLRYMLKFQYSFNVLSSNSNTAKEEFLNLCYQLQAVC